MEQPIARVVGEEVYRHLTHATGHDYGVFDRVADLEEVPVEVHRMRDRTPISHSNPDVITLADTERVGVGEHLAIDGPAVAVAARGQRQVERRVGGAIFLQGGNPGLQAGRESDTC